jgi:hypothetical protein
MLEAQTGNPYAFMEIRRADKQAGDKIAGWPQLVLAEESAKLLARCRLHTGTTCGRSVWHAGGNNFTACLPLVPKHFSLIAASNYCSFGFTNE